MDWAEAARTVQQCQRKRSLSRISRSTHVRELRLMAASARTPVRPRPQHVWHRPLALNHWVLIIELQGVKWNTLGAWPDIAAAWTSSAISQISLLLLFILMLSLPLLGIALLYLHLSEVYGDPLCLQKAKEYATKSLRCLNKRDVTFLCGDAGLYAVASVIFHKLGSAQEADDCVNR